MKLINISRKREKINVSNQQKQENIEWIEKKKWLVKYNERSYRNSIVVVDFLLLI
jgi:hypothetical protein